LPLPEDTEKCRKTDRLGNTEFASRITGCRLNRDILERAFPHHAAVGDAVEGNAPGQAGPVRKKYW